MSMIGSPEHDDLVPAGETAGHPHGGHRCLCPRAHETEQVDASEAFLHFLGQSDFRFRGGPEARAPSRRVSNRTDNRWIRVAE